jgi:hypothetical protein
MGYMSILPTKTDHTYVLDPESPTEMVRLMLQDRMVTVGMGGIFPERPNLDTIHSILDVGCGPGGGHWTLLMSTLTHPSLVLISAGR